MSEDNENNEIQFDPNNFCVQMQGSEDKDRIERALKPLRPNDWEFPEAEISIEPYWGVRDGELTQSALEWVDAMPMAAVMMHIIAYKFRQVLEKSSGSVRLDIKKWTPQPGEMVLGSMTGLRYAKAVFMYYTKESNRYYCVPLKSITPSELDSGQKIIKLTAYKQIRPIGK